MFEQYIQTTKNGVERSRYLSVDKSLGFRWMTTIQFAGGIVLFLAKCEEGWVGKINNPSTLYLRGYTLLSLSTSLQPTRDRAVEAAMELVRCLPKPMTTVTEEHVEALNRKPGGLVFNSPHTYAVFTDGRFIETRDLRGVEVEIVDTDPAGVDEECKPMYLCTLSGERFNDGAARNMFCYPEELVSLSDCLPVRVGEDSEA